MDSIFFLIYIFVFIFGVCIGSFLNCVIYRLEQKRKITGRSFCPNCKHKLSWIDLFPVFSFLCLGGKCRYCRNKISIQYPLAELATGALFILLFNYQNILQSVFYWIIASFLIILFIYDLKHYLIPDMVLFPAIAITLIYNLISPYSITKFWLVFFAIIIASGFFLVIFLASKGKWMGFGDVKLAILMGLLLGLPNVLVALFLAFFFGAIIGVILMIFGKKGLKSEIPFGPFLIAGTFLAILWGPEIINWYLKLFQV
jgi:prepilin signal peptidase PulO-like enzyme (type II secretory pathway)